MSIDWITVIAQIANFLLLVWLLKRFLYRPILDGIDAREAEISRRMAQAGEARNKAEAAGADYQKLKSQLLSDQDEVVDEALRAAESQRDILLANARSKFKQEQEGWHRYLQQERSKFTTQLQQAGTETLLELTRKALHDLADETLEGAIVRHVSTHLHAIAAELSQAIDDNSVAVATTYEALPEAAQMQLQTDMDKLLPGIALRFETDAQQSPGLILRVGSAQVAWTLDSYIDEFDALLNDRLATDISNRVRVDG